LLAPIVAADIDALLLGCTHYPYLSRVISEVMGPKVVLVSSADETAFALADMLRAQDLLAPSGDTGMHTFLSSGDVEWFADFGRRLLGPELSSASRWERSSND
jgi:glutamate racemase